MTAATGGPQLAHIVFFALKESAAGRTAKTCRCVPSLPHRPPRRGVVFRGHAIGFGSRRERPRFRRRAAHRLRNRAAHDAYQTAARHQKFIDENKANWKKVRVFDSNLAERG